MNHDSTINIVLVIIIIMNEQVYVSRTSEAISRAVQNCVVYKSSSVVDRSHALHSHVSLTMLCDMIFTYGFRFIPLHCLRICIVRSSV